MNIQSISGMVGHTLVSAKQDGDALIFTSETGKAWQLAHWQDCCESVCIESLVGDLQDLVGSPILVAEQVTNIPEPGPLGEYPPDSYTWTFYKFATIKGYVDVRWYGESNGYYSESVNLEVKEPGGQWQHAWGY